MTVCIVITRDRVTHTRTCMAALEQTPGLDLHIVDHGSTWPAMLDYLEASPHPVHRRGDHPPRALWDTGDLVFIVGLDRRYLVTDPDVLLDCPTDWLDRLQGELDLGDIVKAGLGLRLDDLPPDGPLTGKIRTWEGQYWATRRSPRSWWAPVDTTLALYRPLAEQSRFALGPAARLDAPYLLRHLPWYGDPAPDETAYYRARLVPGSSHWADGGW